ncbi:MAG: cysteine desulfurase family protein [Christensenellales bacterium]
MIFLDNASTTPALPECAEIMKKYATEEFFNPSAPYGPSVKVSNTLNDARERAAKLLKGDGKIIFTSSGSESNNLVLFGTKKTNNSRIIISESEHPAIKKPAEELRQRGFDVVFCPVDSCGRAIPEKLAELLNDNTSLVSIMHVNNETGGINDIKKLCATVKEFNPKILFHSDGVQAIGKIKVAIDELGVDFYSISGHKFHAPRGVGALYVKKGVNIKPIIFGGGQEFNIRSSTENTAGILAFVYALEQACKNLDDNFNNATKCNALLREAFIGDNFIIRSDDKCSPYIFNFAMKYLRGEVMLHSLEKYEIYVGTGSACSSKKISKNIPAEMKLPEAYEKGILRISISDKTTISDINYFINAFNLEYNNLIKYMRG